MSGRLILIAEASSSSARRGVFADEGLDDKGTEAALALRARLPKRDVCLASPTAASTETASHLDLDATIDPALGDLDLGSWRGRSIAEIADRDAVGATAFAVDATFRGHGGESIAGFVARLRPWLEARRADTGATLVVAPAMVVRALAVAALDADPQTFWRIDVTPLSILTLATDGRRWTLRSFGPD